MLMSTNPKSDYNKMKKNVVIVDITSIINNYHQSVNALEFFYYLYSHSERDIFATTYITLIV